MKTISTLLLLLTAWVLPAQTNFNGPYSSNSNSPTPITLVDGVNTISSTISTPPSSSSWFDLTLPAGATITAVTFKVNDPLGISSGTMCWNPFSTCTPNDSWSSNGQAATQISAWDSAGSVPITSSPGVIQVISNIAFNTTWTLTLTVEGAPCTLSISCPPNSTINTDPGLCEGTISFTVPTVTSSDDAACNPLLTQTAGPSNGSTVGVGIYTLSFEATDDDGNLESCSFEIAIEDNENPEALCQDITVQLDAAGQATISATDIDNGSNDACGIASLSISQSTFDCSNIGPNTVTLTVIDVNNNISTCNATVTVEDNIVPTITCQDTTIDLDMNGVAAITPEDVLVPFPADVLNIKSSSGNNSSFLGGTTDFTVQVTTAQQISFDWDYSTSDFSPDWDPFGYLINGVFFQLTDNGGPNSQTGTTTLNLLDGDEFGFRSRTVDNIAGAAVTTISNFSPGFFGEYAPANWTLELTNSNGNASFVPSSGPVFVDDNCAIASLSISPNTFSQSGTYAVTITATDVNNNSTTCTAQVTVIDPNGPSLAFSEAYSDNRAFLASSMAFDDVDGDNDLDLIYTGATQRNQFGLAGGEDSRLFKNDGNGFLSPTGTKFMGLSYSSLSFHDINNDSKMDVVSSGETYSNGVSHVKYYTNNGNGTFSPATGPSFPNMNRRDFKIEDFDNDGVKDVLFIGLDQGTNTPISRLFENTGTAINPSYFNRFTPSPLPGVRDGSIAAADVNGDDLTDIFISGRLNNGTKIAKIYTNNGNFQFSELSATTLHAVDSGDSTFADVDDDGDQDLLISGKDSNNNNILKLYLNDGLGVFTEAVDAIDISSNFLMEAFEFADLDGDGDYDVLLGGYNTSTFERMTTMWENLLYSQNAPLNAKHHKPGLGIDFGDEQNQVAFNGDLTIYPNPSSIGYVNINTNQVKGQTEISITDALGRKVLSQNIDVKNNSIAISTEGLAPGLYFVNLNSNNSYLSGKLIIK